MAHAWVDIVVDTINGISLLLGNDKKKSLKSDKQILKSKSSEVKKCVKNLDNTNLSLDEKLNKCEK
jgi:hypothetical protein